MWIIAPSFLFLLLLSSTTAVSQSIRSYGILLGAASATQSWDYHDTPYPSTFDPDERWGIDVGLFMEFLDNPVISVLGELHYIQKGFSESFVVSTPANPEGTGQKYSYRPSIDYLSIPVLLKLRTDIGSVTSFLKGGPRVDIRIGQSDENTFGKFERTDIGISGALGAEIPLDISHTILVEFRYSPSLTNSYEAEFVTVKNSSLEFLLGVVL
jgi:hypothetical protein